MVLSYNQRRYLEGYRLANFFSVLLTITVSLNELSVTASFQDNSPKLPLLSSSSSLADATFDQSATEGDWTGFVTQG